ncbi:MAG: hypothetical protein FJ033_16465 [Chloroflexi bacterium]|nr:hypothetical protein [Chloroflexota bacterium]
MPSRVIRGEILSSDTLSRVSLEAEALFWRLLIAADDFGRLDGRLPVLRALLFPIRNVPVEHIEEWLCELEYADESGGPLLRYVVEGRPYVLLQKWEKHRSNSKRAKESRFPAPPTGPRECPGIPRGVADIRPSVGVGVGDEWGVRESEESAAPTPTETRLSAPRGDEFSWIVPLLAAKGGDADELEAWLAEMWPEIVSAAEVEAPTPEKLPPAIRRIGHARWRVYLRGERPFRGIAERRAHQTKIDAWERGHGAAAREDATAETLP